MVIKTVEFGEGAAEPTISYYEAETIQAVYTKDDGHWCIKYLKKSGEIADTLKIKGEIYFLENGKTIDTLRG